MDLCGYHCLCNEREAALSACIWMAWWVWQWWRGWCTTVAQPCRFVRAPAAKPEQISAAATPASRRKPEWVVTEVLRLKVHLGPQGCRRVADTFNRLHSQRGTTIGKTFVAECLTAHQYALACMRQEMRKRLPRPVSINAVWAMDLTFYTDATGRQQMALGILDHGSRLVTCLHTLANKRSWTLLGYLCLAIGTYGKPRRIRTDNEIIFTSWVFTTFLQLVGIRHQRIQTCAPWQNGRMERLFGTLKPLLRQLVIPSKAALQQALQEFTLFYNHARPHQNLAGLTPAEKWNGWSTVDLAQTPAKRAVLVQALDGLMVGYCMRR
jgi:putative transposase